jgi:hypothetical protein
MARDFLLVTATVVGACAGEANPDDGEVEEEDPLPRCTASDTTSIVMVPALQTAPGTSTLAAWRIAGRLSPTTFVASAHTEGNGQRIAIIDDTGDAVDVVRIEDGAYYSVKAAVSGGCAVIASKQGLGRACPGAPYDHATTIQRVSGESPLFAVDARDSTWVYTQTYASFTAVERTAQGVWTEHEQYESSISLPTDAVVLAGEPVACFLAASGRAVVAHGAGRVTTTGAARWCKLAVANDGQAVHVVTDLGHTTRTLASLGARDTLALSPLVGSVEERPERVVTLRGAPYALVTSMATIDLVPIMGGATISLPRPDGAFVVHYDEQTAALEVLSERARFDGPGPEYPQTFRRQTHCL